MFDFIFVLLLVCCMFFCCCWCSAPQLSLPLSWKTQPLTGISVPVVDGASQLHDQLWTLIDERSAKPLVDGSVFWAGDTFVHRNTGAFGVVVGKQGRCDASLEWCQQAKIKCAGCPTCEGEIDVCYWAFIDNHYFPIYTEAPVLIPASHMTHFSQKGRMVQHPQVDVLFVSQRDDGRYEKNRTIFGKSDTSYVVPDFGCPSGYVCIVQSHQPPMPHDGKGQCCMIGSTTDCLNDEVTFGNAGRCKAPPGGWKK